MSGRDLFDRPLLVTAPASLAPAENVRRTTVNKNTICLWYNHDAEEAARFYAKTFPDSASTGFIKHPPTFRAARPATS